MPVSRRKALGALRRRSVWLISPVYSLGTLLCSDSTAPCPRWRPIGRTSRASVVRQRGVHRHGKLGRDPPSRPRRRPLRACRLPRVQDPLEDPPEDPRQRRAARLPAHQAQAALDPRTPPAGRPSDPRGRQEGPQEAAAHRQADLRSAQGRARLPRRLDHRQGCRPRLAAQHRRGLRPPGPPARRGPGRLRPRRGHPRRPGRPRSPSSS